MSRLNLLFVSMFGLIFGIHPVLAATFGQFEANTSHFYHDPCRGQYSPTGSTVLVCPAT